MAAANIASTGIVLEALTRDNYLNWSTLVQNYLMGKDLWVNIVVEGDSRQFNDPDGRIWESKNRKALHAIQLSCGSQTLGQIRNCKTAKDAWNHLRAVFSEDLRADVHDIEQGHVQNDRLALLHSAVKKGSWNEAKSIINHGNRDIISQKSLSNGWTALHVAVDAGQEQIMKELVKIGALLTEQDWEGYTPLALAAKSTDDEKIAEWMVSTGGEDLLTSKIRAYDDKGDIPVIHAAAKGHKEMTRWLFSKTCWTNSFNLLDDTGHYRAKLLSHCIHAEIFDVAATLLQYHDDDCTQLPLNYESDQCTRPMYGLAHIPTAFPSGTGFNCCQQSFYNILSLPASIDITEGKRIDIESHDGGSNTHPLADLSLVHETQDGRGIFLLEDAS